ncbi:MAG: hypothetical protein HS113_18820 [Verrucomicrobiales bacterium]|nr:hypothetical protein [Verrucomicrobiales bacterium]
MTRLFKTGLLAVVAATLTFLPSQALAQGQRGGGQGGQGGQRGNFDPEQMRQRIEQRMREQFGVTDDAEWKVIADRIQKVTELRRDAAFGGMRGMMRPPGGDQQGPAGARQRFGGEASPEEEALTRVIESNASAEQIKTAMAKYRDARKANDEKLAKAQEDLKAVLSVKQEAVALRMGLVR